MGTVFEDPLPGMLQNAAENVATHIPMPTLEQMKASFPGSAPPPAVVVISCCDPRVSSEMIFGNVGLNVIEIRNAGGRANEALRSIICMDQLVGVGIIIVVHHTDCGMTHLRNDFIRTNLSMRVPSHSTEISEMQFGEILDLPASVAEDMKLLREAPFLKAETKIVGYVYDIVTGKLDEVEGRGSK